MKSRNFADSTAELYFSISSSENKLVFLDNIKRDRDDYYNKRMEKIQIK